MSNRNFDNRVIIQRLQDKNYARNLYLNNTIGQRIITNPQNSDGNASRFTTYHDGSQTEYYKGLLGGNITVNIGGIVNIPPYPVSSITVPIASNFDWMTTIGGSDTLLLNLTTDLNRNAFVNGVFSTPSTLIYQFEMISSGIIHTSLFGSLPSQNGPYTSLITKYAPSGQCLWATTIETNNPTSGRPMGNMITDSQGNVYVTGSFTNSSIITNYNGISSGTIITSEFGRLVGSTDEVYIVKYNSSGTAQWATNMSGLLSWGVTADSSANIYLSGQFSNSTIINSYQSISSGVIMTSTFGVLNGVGGNDLYLVKLNSSGVVQWATNIGGITNESESGITIDSNANIYVGGSFTNSSIFNSFVAVSSGVVSTTSFGLLPASTSIDGFVAKYNTSGQIQWATRQSGTAAQRVWDLDVDSFSNVYATGSYVNSTLIYNYDSVSSGIISTSLFGRLPVTVSGQDAFLIKYDTLGTVQWATNIGGTALDTGYNVAVDTNNNVYVGGLFGAPSTFINQVNTISSGVIIVSTFGRLVTGTTGQDGYLAKYTSSGQVQWATSLDGPPTTNISQWGLSLDSLGNVYMSGSFVSSLFVNVYSTVSSAVIITSTVGEIYSPTPSLGRSGYLVRYNPDGTIMTS